MKLDHVVYFTKKAPLEIVWEQKKMGWHAVQGGSHQQWGTYNALMYVNNAYIEWLSIEHEDIANASNNPLVQLYLYDQQDKDGWGTLCFSVEQIEEMNARLKNLGYKTSGVLHAERKTITGEIRKWKMLFIDEQPSDALPFPFFIEWEIPESERLQVLRENGAVLRENEQLAITNCLLNVRNIEETMETWQAILGVESIEDTVIPLLNCQLEFSQSRGTQPKERLIDVSIEYVE